MNWPSQRSEKHCFGSLGTIRKIVPRPRHRGLERFPAKWTPVRVKKTRQNKKLEARSDSIGTEKALAARAELRPVQFFFELMKRIIANIFGFAQLQDRAARGGDGAAAQRVGG